MKREELVELLKTLVSLVAARPEKYYLKSLFSDIYNYSYDDMIEALKEFEEDAEIRLLYSKVRDSLEARLVEAALNGKIPPSTAQFVLQTAFELGKDSKFGGQNVVIVYKSLEEAKNDDEEVVEGLDG